MGSNTKFSSQGWAAFCQGLFHSIHLRRSEHLGRLWLLSEAPNCLLRARWTSHPECCPLWCKCPSGCSLPPPMSSGLAMPTDTYGLQQQNYSSQDKCSKIYMPVCAMKKGEISFALHWISPTSQQPNWKMNYSPRLIPKASPAGQQGQAAAQGEFLLGLRWWQSKRSAIKRKQINFPLLKLGEPCIGPCIK